FHSYEREQEREILDVEVRFEVPLNGNTLVGRIDCVSRRPDGTLEIIDYKSGKTPPTGAEKELQLGMYQIAYTHFHAESMPSAVVYTLGHKDDRNGTFVPDFDTKKQVASQEYDPEKVDVVVEKIRDISGSILRNEFQTTTNSYTCTNCAYRHVCEGANE